MLILVFRGKVEPFYNGNWASTFPLKKLLGNVTTRMYMRIDDLINQFDAEDQQLMAKAFGVGIQRWSNY